MDNLKNSLNLIASPQTWTEIVRSVLAAEYGTAYKGIDDSVSDSGNDGYLSSEKRLFARHCFVKPAGKTIAKIVTKMESDLKKAIKLKETGELEIEHWTFVCNYDIPHAVMVKLQKAASLAAIEADYMTSDYIANLLIKNPEVLKRFSFLPQNEIGESLGAINSKLDELIAKSSDTTPSEPVDPSVEEVAETTAMMTVRPQNLTKEQRESLNNDTDYQFVVTFADSQPTPDDKAKIKAVIYTSSNPMIRLQALAVVDNWFDPLTEDVDEYLSLANIGMSSAVETNNPSAQAESLGIRLKYVSQKLSLIHMQIMEIDMYANSGLFVPNPDVRNRLVQEIQTFDAERTQLMHDILAMATIANDAQTIGDSNLKVADAAGHIGALLKRTGNLSDANAQIKLAKLAYTEAQKFYNAAGLNDRALYAMSNLANMLRDIGEPKTAIIIAQKVIDEADKMGLSRLKTTAEKIKLHTQKGKVPDYANGETDIEE